MAYKSFIVLLVHKCEYHVWWDCVLVALDNSSMDLFTAKNPYDKPNIIFTTLH